MRAGRIAAVLSLLALVSGSAHADRPRQHIDQAPSRALADLGVWRMEGIASWYGGTYFHGRPMANGRRFDRMGRSMAHKSLPLGTVVRLTNPANGRTETVKVEDRGPFIHGRAFDVSEGTATRLGFKQQGLARLQAEILR